MIVHTESGAQYEFDATKTRVRRLEADSGNSKRRDGDWLRLKNYADPRIGYRMLLTLEPLDANAVATTRLTTAVTQISEDTSRG